MSAEQIIQRDRRKDKNLQTQMIDQQMGLPNYLQIKSDSSFRLENLSDVSLKSEKNLQHVLLVQCAILPVMKTTFSSSSLLNFPFPFH